jgi:hypothetical protein
MAAWFAVIISALKDILPNVEAEACSPQIGSSQM